MDSFFGRNNSQMQCRGVLHIVEYGDTLYKIGKKYGVPLSRIMYANPYVNVYNLQVGDEICVPVMSPRDLTENQMNQTNRQSDRMQPPMQGGYWNGTDMPWTDAGREMPVSDGGRQRMQPPVMPSYTGDREPESMPVREREPEGMPMMREREAEGMPPVMRDGEMEEMPPAMRNGGQNGMPVRERGVEEMPPVVRDRGQNGMPVRERGAEGMPPVMRDGEMEGMPSVMRDGGQNDMPPYMGERQPEGMPPQMLGMCPKRVCSKVSEMKPWEDTGVSDEMFAEYLDKNGTKQDSAW